jgi:F-type H+-transporting ATPase subunit gamma
MANTRALVKRRKAIRNIRKITRTMELIATARFKKALDRAVEAEAFTRKIAELAADLSANATDLSHPLLERREKVHREVLLVLSSNRGLCGGYNAAVLREAGGQLQRDRQEGVEVQLEASGKRAIAYYRYQGIPAAHTYTQFEDRPEYHEVEVIAERYIAEYVGKRIDRVSIAYTKFLNASRQVAMVETLLPMTALAPEARRRPGEATRQVATKVEYEFLPSAASILEQILPQSFKILLFKCFLDAAVSEQIARRVAMKAATENAGDMIKELSRKYNRARQAQITKEISEIISGAAALE